jgi:hypothetical protein
MPLPLTINMQDKHEIVLYDSEQAKSAHQELYRYSDEAYTKADEAEGIFYFISEFIENCNCSKCGELSRIHLVLSWKNLLHIALWQKKSPTPADAAIILKSAGITAQELEPFMHSDAADIFPFLYYGKRFDILRKLCHKTKKQVEGRLKANDIRIDCHLMAEDTARIVASSL